MPIAYVTIPGSAIKAQGHSLIITKDDATLASLEIIHLTGLILIGRIAVTTPALYRLLQHNIPTILISRSAKIRGRLMPFAHTAVEERIEQALLMQDESRRLVIARRVVAAKIEAMQHLLAQHQSNHPGCIPQNTKHTLQRATLAVNHATSLSSLLGQEGAASAAYWKAYARLNRSNLPFNGRSRRPPADPVNALLSFGYALLLAEFVTAIESADLDAYIGVYHETTSRRPALALDLMEPFRHAVVDRLVLNMINRRERNIQDFTHRSGGWYLKRSALPHYIAAFEKTMLNDAPSCLLGKHEQNKHCDVRTAIQRRVQAYRKWLNRTPPSSSANSPRKIA